MPSLAFFKNIDGVAAVEFAFLAPVFGLILAGANDLGGMLYMKYDLDAGVSTAANYAFVNAASVGSSGGTALASAVASIVTSSSSSNGATSTIVVNNGPTATTTAGASASTASGTAANADSCYCPTLGASGVDWGSAETCGAVCPNKTLAGKFVYITASQTYAPLVQSYGFINNWTVSTSAMVQTQ